MARKNASRGAYIPNSITLEGGLFSADLLEKICKGVAPFQTKDDYAVPKGLQLSGEYARAFNIAKAQWADFRVASRQKSLDTLTKEAVSISFVKIFLRDVFGYANVKETAPILLAEIGYPISMICPPVVVAAYDSGLDEASRSYAFVGSNRKKTPFQLMQEYLNAVSANAGSVDSEAGWGIVTNGRVIRLLRSSDFLTRPKFLEFDLESILGSGISGMQSGDDTYADFRALWYVFHYSRMEDEKTEPVWEKWVKKGDEEGARVRENLRHGLGKALLALGDGFVSHPDNVSFREKLSGGKFKVHDFYRELLRLIYRVLFVIVLEERGLLHGSEEPPAVYSSGYSFRRLRDRSLRAVESARYTDLWHCVRIVFRGLASGEPRLALPALGGLFLGDQCPELDNCALSNRALMSAMRSPSGGPKSTPCSQLSTTEIWAPRR